MIQIDSNQLKLRRKLIIKKILKRIINLIIIIPKKFIYIFNNAIFIRMIKGCDES